MLRPLIFAFFMHLQLQLALEVHDHLDGSSPDHCPSYLVSHAASQALVEVALPALLWTVADPRIPVVPASLPVAGARSFDPHAPRGPPA